MTDELDRRPDESEADHLARLLIKAGEPLPGLRRDPHKGKMADPATPFAERLRLLAGFIENGTDTAVAFAQDDATKQWYVRVGTRNRKYYYGDTLPGAFEKAFQDPRNDPFA